MSQIENMPWTASCTLQYVVHFGLNYGPRSEHKCGIEIALDAEIVTDALPGVIQVYAPIDADNRGSIPFHLVQQCGRAGPKVDGGRAGLPNCVKDAAIVG